MNATPQRRSEQAEREELARLLPAAANPDLSRSRHLLLKEHLMNTVADHNRSHPAKPSRSRRTLALRIAIPAGLAAAGIAIASLTGHPVIASPQASDPVAAVGTISAVGYTLRSGTDHLVTLTVTNGESRIDLNGLQHNLARMGVRARVYGGDPGCRNGIRAVGNAPDLDGLPAAPAADVAKSGLTFVDQGEATVLEVVPGKIPAGDTLFLYFPLAETSPVNTFRDWESGLLRGTIPTCLPAQTYTNPFAAQEQQH
jgi:hypothetical protein